MFPFVPNISAAAVINARGLDRFVANGAHQWLGSQGGWLSMAPCSRGKTTPSLSSWTVRGRRSTGLFQGHWAATVLVCVVSTIHSRVYTRIPNWSNQGCLLEQFWTRVPLKVGHFRGCFPVLEISRKGCHQPKSQWSTRKKIFLTVGTVRQRNQLS